MIGFNVPFDTGFVALHEAFDNRSDFMSIRGCIGQSGRSKRITEQLNAGTCRFRSILEQLLGLRFHIAVARILEQPIDKSSPWRSRLCNLLAGISILGLAAIFAVVLEHLEPDRPESYVKDMGKFEPDKHDEIDF